MLRTRAATTPLLCIACTLIFLSTPSTASSDFLRDEDVGFRAMGRKKYSEAESQCQYRKKMYQYCINDCIYIPVGGDCGPGGTGYYQRSSKPCKKWEKLYRDKHYNSRGHRLIQERKTRDCKINCEQNHPEAQYCSAGRSSTTYLDTLDEEVSTQIASSDFLRDADVGFRAMGRKKYSEAESQCQYRKKMYSYCIKDCIYVRPGGNCGTNGRNYRPCKRWEKLLSDLRYNSEGSKKFAERRAQDCKINCQKNHPEAQYCSAGRTSTTYLDTLDEEVVGAFSSPVQTQNMATWSQRCAYVTCTSSVTYSINSGPASRCPGGLTAYKRRNVWRNGVAQCCSFSCCSRYNPSQRCRYRL